MACDKSLLVLLRVHSVLFRQKYAENHTMIQPLDEFTKPVQTLFGSFDHDHAQLSVSVWESENCSSSSSVKSAFLSPSRALHIFWISSLRSSAFCENSLLALESPSRTSTAAFCKSEGEGRPQRNTTEIRRKNACSSQCNFNSSALLNHSEFLAMNTWHPPKKQWVNEMSDRICCTDSWNKA